MTNPTALAIIGAGYGDEGKGLAVDVLAAARPGTIVVRSNGGAQAGHTVVAPDGRRHVFHHVGAGAFADAPTHLSRFFVAHPMMLREELQRLAGLGVRPTLGIDPRALVTTPFDVLVNQAVEIARGTARHGSTGLGIGETIERNLRPAFATAVIDLFSPDLRDRLVAIRREWVPVRLASLGVASLPPELAAASVEEAMIEQFLADADQFLARVALRPDARLAEAGTVVFEGAQGLLLDQEYGAFPWVTRSHTGVRNMLAIAAEAGIAGIEAIYMTRAYRTRHGAGPLPGERSLGEAFKIADPTNAPNPWQGTLRFAPLDPEILGEAIAHDVALSAASGVSVIASLAVTCLDQAVGPVPFGTQALDPRVAASQIAARIGVPLTGESWGPSRTTWCWSGPARKAA